MHCKKAAQTELLLSENIPKRGRGGLLDSKPPKTPSRELGELPAGPQALSTRGCANQKPQGLFPELFFPIFITRGAHKRWKEPAPAGNGPNSPHPLPKNPKSYSQGTEVTFRAPTQRSLCFFLWLMYCKILTGSPSLSS